MESASLSMAKSRRRIRASTSSSSSGPRTAGAGLRAACSTVRRGTRSPTGSRSRTRPRCGRCSAATRATFARSRRRSRCSEPRPRAAARNSYNADGFRETVSSRFSQRALGLSLVVVLALTCAGAAALASAHALKPSIASTDNPSRAGEQLIIFGLAPGAASAVLWQQLPGQKQAVAAGRAPTDSSGDYLLVRAPQTNVDWFVKAGGVKSRVLHQRVSAVVTLARSVADASPRQPVIFTGTVSPSHAGQRVLLQKRVG